MNYRKYIYRRLDYLVDKAVKMLKDGQELTTTFRAAKEKSDKLLKRVEKLYGDARRDKKDVPMSPEWCAIVEEAESLRRESEKLLRDSVRPYLGPQFVNVHLLVGYCPQTIPYYQKMIKELRRTFPQAKIKDVECRQVTKSSCVKGFTLITWSGECSFKETGEEYGYGYALDSKDSKDWYVSENCEYYW
jgi:hypothetical protein